MNLDVYGAGILRAVGFNSLLRILYKSFPLPLFIRQGLRRCYLHPSFNFKRSDLLSENAQARKVRSRLTRNARQSDAHDRWVLVAELQVPTSDRDSGSVRMSAIIQLLQDMGFRITFVRHSAECLSYYESHLEKQGINIVRGLRAARRHLKSDGGKYHFALLSRPCIAFHYLPYAREYAPNATIIYDTVDLHWVRIEREMQLSSDRNLLKVIERFRRIELLNAAGADLVFAITHEERNRLLLEQPGTNIVVLPNIHRAYPPRRAFHQRKGLLFIGGFRHRPNEDAVIYFAKDILPAIIEKIPDMVFYIIGSDMPASINGLRSANVEPIGFVPDVEPYFESTRLFVAPLRFGAGMKGKVGQSMSHGLPVVTTGIGAEGMGLHHEKHALIADSSQDFADSVVRLYTDENLWSKLSAESFSYLDTHFSVATARKQIADIFTPRKNAACR